MHKEKNRRSQVQNWSTASASLRNFVGKSCKRLFLTAKSIWIYVTLHIRYGTNIEMSAINSIKGKFTVELLPKSSLRVGSFLMSAGPCYIKCTEKARCRIGEKVFIVTAILSFVVCMRVTTSTGMIAVVVLTLLMIMPIGIRKILSSNYALIAAAVIINILNFGTAQLMNNVYVQYFIHDVLGKPSTLSGRAQIWAIIFGFIRKKLFLGYGYYNGMIETYLGYGNPQNGVLKILLDTGIIGLLLYSILVFVALRPLNGKNFALNFPIIAFLYAMIVASLVEINLTHMIVFMALAIVAFGCERKEINS